MRKLILLIALLATTLSTKATIHTVLVWNGYYQFVDANITIQLGDTVQWLPLDPPSMQHTITSSNIPVGAAPFDQIWQLPADTFFQYVPTVVGVYDYVCTPHIALGMIGSITVQSGPIGIATNQPAPDVIVYPNPAKEQLFVQGIEGLQPYMIYSHSGQLVLSGTTSGTIDVNELTTGIYYLELTGNLPRRLRFIKR